MSGGLTSTGFVAETVEEIQADLNADLLAEVSPTLDLSSDQPIGQIVGIMAEKFAELWELLATVYNGTDPDSAEGAQLAGLCALSGTRPQSATYSTVSCTLNLNASVTVPLGSVAYVAGQTSNRWVLQAAVTNSGGSPADVLGSFQAEAVGPQVANAGTLTGIATPVIGWNTITNAADATLGLSEDTDATLRVKRKNELAAPGSGDVDAIRADILEIPGVVQSFVYENTGFATDSNGVPGKSFHVILWDGTSPVSNNTIAQTIWNAKPSGIQAYGTLSGTATDSQGNSQTVYFDRVTQVPIYFTLTTTLLPTAPSNYRALVKAALAEYATTALNQDVDVFALAFRAQALSVLGVEDVPTFFLGTAPSPGGTTNITITSLQIATVSTTHILVDGS